MEQNTAQNEWNASELMNMTAQIREYKNPLVIYHGNCADGFSAAWVFYKVQDIIEQGFDFHPGVYNDSPPDCSGRHVYMVDFSYKPEVLKEILKVCDGLTIIDHHKSAIEAIQGDEELSNLIKNTEALALDTDEPAIWFHYSLDKCGATLAWDYWEESFKQAGVERPLLLGHIEDRDLWRFKLPNTREIQANVFSYEYTFENWDKLMAAGQLELLQMTVAGAAIERKHHKDIKELLNVCQRTLCIAGYDVPVASLPYIFSSDAAHAMAKSHKDGTEFAACYWDTPTHRVFSLRSCDNGMDVSAIAEEYGGGGHKNAAGFRVPRSHRLAVC